MPALLPAGEQSLPLLGGGLFLAYRIAWWMLLASVLTAVGASWFDPGVGAEIWALRLVKAAVLVAVSVILYRRRSRDPVAAMLSLAFFLWTLSSSIDFVSADALPSILDRFRFLFFALALLLFPDSRWREPVTTLLAAAIVATFLLGVAEATGLLASKFYLPTAIACVLAALAGLIAKYRATPEGTQKQQLKWVMLGLFLGIALILGARSASALTLGMAMPMIGTAAIEATFQLGIIVLALGFLTSLLRYRLYDAEAAISRSAIYASLTLSLVGTFAACEALLELLGQRFFGGSFGSVSGALAAAVAAILLTPLHERISKWVEAYVQRDLAVLKTELPDLLLALSGDGSVERLAKAVLPPIQAGVQATRIALVVDGRLAGAVGVDAEYAAQLLRVGRDAQGLFPFRLPLRCPLGSGEGWLLLGPRPDGSLYGKDDLDALMEILPAMQRSLFQVSQREKREAALRKASQLLERKLERLAARLGALETERLAS